MFAAAQTSIDSGLILFQRFRISRMAALHGWLRTLAQLALTKFQTGRYMHAYQTAHWPQSDTSLVSFKKSAKQPGDVPESEAPTAVLGKTDMQIARDVRNELEMEPSVRAAAIGVHVNGGVVTLSGVVDSDGERWLIESAARRIVGVKSVLAQLKVFAFDVTPTDDDIAHDCERVLRDLTPTADYAIGVMVSNGWVTLSGYVAEGYERSIAETEVSSLLSVHGVNSQLKVRPLLARNAGGAGTTTSTRRQNELKSGSYEFADDYEGIAWSGMRKSWTEHRAMLHTMWSASGAKHMVDRIRPS